MGKKIQLFKTLSSENIKELKIRCNKTYYYIKDDVMYYINEKEVENSMDDLSFQLDLDNCPFVPGEDELYMNIEFELGNKNILFNKLNVCSINAIMGIGLQWKAKGSRIKNCIKLGEFEYNDFENIVFKVNDIRLVNTNSNIDFSYIIYVVDPGAENISYASQEGIVIGEENLGKMINEGVGSTFPISETNDSNKPLWYYRCDFDSLDEDFKECVEIILNTAHPLSSLYEDKKYSNKFYMEVISSALASIIEDIKNKLNDRNEKIDFNNKYEEGSIGYALCYYKDAFGFKMEGTYKELLESIKLFMDKK